MRTHPPRWFHRPFPRQLAFRLSNGSARFLLRSSYPTHHLPSQLTRSRPGRALLSLPNSDPRLLTRHPFHLSHRRPDFFSLDVNADYDLDPSRQPSTATHPSPPEPERALECGWFRASSRFRSPMLQLHKEIIDFCEFLSPTSEEELSRSSAVEGVFNVIKYIWPHRKVEVFGLFKTSLLSSQ